MSVVPTYLELLPRDVRLLIEEFVHGARNPPVAVRLKRVSKHQQRKEESWTRKCPDCPRKWGAYEGRLMFCCTCKEYYHACYNHHFFFHWAQSRVRLSVCDCLSAVLFVSE